MSEGRGPATRRCGKALAEPQASSSDPELVAAVDLAAAPSRLDAAAALAAAASSSVWRARISHALGPPRRVFFRFFSVGSAGLVPEGWPSGGPAGGGAAEAVAADGPWAAGSGSARSSLVPPRVGSADLGGVPQSRHMAPDSRRSNLCAPTSGRRSPAVGEGGGTAEALIAAAAAAAMSPLSLAPTIRRRRSMLSGCWKLALRRRGSGADWDVGGGPLGERDRARPHGADRMPVGSVLACRWNRPELPVVVGLADRQLRPMAGAAVSPVRSALLPRARSTGVPRRHSPTTGRKTTRSGRPPQRLSDQTPNRSDKRYP